MWLKVVLLGYARGLLSSRRLEAACQQNIIFMALCCGQRPDHSTIAGFVSGMGEEGISSLFSQVLLVCAEGELLGGTHFAIDGYKLSSNAAKECSGTHADLRKKQAKLRELVRDSVREHRRNDRENTAAAASQSARVTRLNPRQVRVFHGRVTETLTSRMKEKIDTPEGRALYSRRLGIVEPVFGNIGAQKGMSRSTLRGTVKVNIQWRLYCLVHNLEKLGRYAPLHN